MTTSAEGTEAVLGFWFDEAGPDRWWVRSHEVDDAIVERFRDLWAEWRSRTPESFLGSAREALAGVILFDQFSRNLFRDHADAFSTDPLALAIARRALDRGLDKGMSEDERSFLYMPFQHSEALSYFAHEHRDMIARYGRFPARTAALGRANRPGEEEAIALTQDW